MISTLRFHGKGVPDTGSKHAVTDPTNGQRALQKRFHGYELSVHANEGFPCELSRHRCCF